MIKWHVPEFPTGIRVRREVQSWWARRCPPPTRRRGRCRPRAAGHGAGLRHAPAWPVRLFRVAPYRRVIGQGPDDGRRCPAGYGATDLEDAYSLPADGGAGQTVATVDANNDPAAEQDLAVYRAGRPAR
jgi:hypothetical protein